jgi:hypothetical protein
MLCQMWSSPSRSGTPVRRSTLRESHPHHVEGDPAFVEPVQQHAERVGAGDLQLVGALQIQQESSGVGAGVGQGGAPGLARWPRWDALFGRVRAEGVQAETAYRRLVTRERMAVLCPGSND